MSSIFEYVSYGEFIRLVVCTSLDVSEYLIIFLLTPILGDLFSFISLAVSVYMFSWFGVISLLDFVPGLDLLPINVITWIVWVLNNRRKDIMAAMR